MTIMVMKKERTTITSGPFACRTMRNVWMRAIQQNKQQTEQHDH